MVVAVSVGSLGKTFHSHKFIDAYVLEVDGIQVARGVIGDDYLGKSTDSKKVWC